MHLANITFDADDPQRLAAFWSDATGRTVAHSEPYFAMLNPDDTGARMLFLKVLEGKTAKAHFSTPQTFPGSQHHSADPTFIALATRR